MNKSKRNRYQGKNKRLTKRNRKTLSKKQMHVCQNVSMLDEGGQHLIGAFVKTILQNLRACSRASEQIV